MPRTKRLLQIAAVAASVLLAGGFICYQAGAFDFLTRSRQQREQPKEEGGNEILFHGSKSLRLTPKPPDTFSPKSGDTSLASKEEMLMLGSKSAPIFTQPAPKPPEKGTAEQTAPPASQPSVPPSR